MCGSSKGKIEKLHPDHSYLFCEECRKKPYEFYIHKCPKEKMKKYIWNGQSMITEDD